MSHALIYGMAQAVASTVQSIGSDIFHFKNSYEMITFIHTFVQHLIYFRWMHLLTLNAYYFF